MNKPRKDPKHTVHTVRLSWDEGNDTLTSMFGETNSKCEHLGNVECSLKCLLSRQCLIYCLIFRLSEVDGSLLDLPNLTHLHLQGNSLLQVTRINLPSLIQIRLGSNRLESLDKSILDSRQLTLLDLSANPLESLPDNIFEKLEDIKTLNVEGTKLRAIPTIPDQIRFNDLNMKNVPLFWLVIIAHFSAS